MNRNKLSVIWHEPLLHFLVIGAALFFIFDQFDSTPQPQSNSITITQADLDRLADAWLKRMGRPATEKERQQQLKYYIREQVLYREAMAMGLDENDVIVRRRLAKKMEYLFNDLNWVPDPTDTQLQEFLEKNSAIFIRPAHISFKQIYVDPGEHGQLTEEYARQLMKKLAGKNNKIDPVTLGDRSLLPHEFHQETKNEITSLFGADFSKQIFSLTTNRWQGSITSAYGSHLVYIQARAKAVLPALNEIKARVESEWRASEQQRANNIFYQSLLQRYKIVLDDTVSSAVTALEKQ